MGTRDLTADRRVSGVRLFAAGCAAAALVVLGGFGVELYRFGRDDQAAAAGLERAVQTALDAMTADVARVAHAVSADPTDRDAMDGNPAADESARRLFDAA